MPAIELQKQLDETSSIVGSKRDVDKATALIEVTKKEDEVTEFELEILRKSADTVGWTFEGFQFDGNKNVTYAYFER